MPASEKPCMGHSLSRGDFSFCPLCLDFVWHLFLLQFYCSASAEPFSRPGRSFRAPTPRSGGQRMALGPPRSGAKRP
jgi:hypothetical protein